jgi:hypothetical protein
LVKSSSRKRMKYTEYTTVRHKTYTIAYYEQSRVF